MGAGRARGGSVKLHLMLFENENFKQRSRHALQVTAKDAFLEHPKILFHIKRYLASLSSMGARRGGSVDVGDRDMGTRCLDCLEQIRDFQNATTAEQRRKRWAVMRM